MSFLTVDASEENVRDYTGSGNYITKSGIYDVIIKAVTVNSTAKGSEYLNLVVEYNGVLQTLYQAIRLTNNDGSANLGQKLFNKLCVVAGLEHGQEIKDPVTVLLPIGKGGEKVECSVLEEFNDLPIYIRIQMEYSLYNNNIQQTKNVMNFFRYEDKATAQEIVNHSETIGKQYELEAEYADKVVYKDDLTAEDVAEWIKNKSKTNTKEQEKKPSTGFTRKFSKK